MLKNESLNKYSYQDLIFLSFLLVLSFAAYYSAQNLLFPFTIFVIIFLISVFVFFSYLFYTSNLYLLYYSLATFIMSLWVLASAEDYLDRYFFISEAVKFRLSLSIYLAIPFLALFFYEIFKEVFSEKVLLLIQVYGFILYLLIFLMPLEIVNNIVLFNSLSAAVLAYIIYTALKSLLKKNKDSIFFLWNLIFLAAVISSNYLNLNQPGFFNFNLQSAVFSFVFLQTVVLLHIYSRNFRELKNQLTDLKKEKNSLKKRNKIKNRFALQQLKNLSLPINRILSAVENIRHKNELNSREKEDLSALKNNSQALKQMLDNSQFYFEIQKNSQQLRKEKFELREIIEQVINFFDFYISEQELKIKNLIEENKYIIKTDRSHFMHAVFNILSELKEFSSKAEIVFTAAESASELKLNISLQSADAVFMQLKNVEEQQTGDFKAENIFEYRQQKTAEIFSKLGGELDFRKEDKNHFQISLSFPGRMYTDFYLEKVNYRKERTQFSKTAESENKKEGENIKAETEKLKIIVYSSQQRDNLRILEDFLLLQDYRLKKVRTKSELTAEIDKKTVLLIFDIFSLGEEELGYCREIRERFTLFQLPILIIASRSLPENMIRSFEIGINDFIKKPFEISELKSRIRTLISLKEKVEESFRQEQNYLRAQIKPHFLYNTLDTIAYLCQSDPELAGELIIDLANYLRYSFDFDNLDQLVSINKELDLVKFYVSIQQQRFKNKFRVEYQLEDNLDFKVPPLVLQSLVENSVKHGFSEMKEGGLIKISVQEKENFYLIEVSDNGIGISKEKIADIFSEKTRKEENRRQIGLKNINRRLKRLFDQKLEVENGLKQGTVVKVRIPKNQAVE